MDTPRVATGVATRREGAKRATAAAGLVCRVPREGELTELTEIDLAEISAVPVPANAGARTLSIKSAQSVQLVSFEVA